MGVIDLIMNTSILKENPPIFLDVGASGRVHHKWKEISKYSICIAFDPDMRDVDEIQGDKMFLKTHFIESLVSHERNKNENFYLTKSPYCSSMLRPLQLEINKYSFGHLFEVEKIIKVGATTLEEVLGKLDITKVDWIKIDAQGIDLRVFQSLPQWKKVITVEFEPGFIDAYENEDKVDDVLSFMGKQNFWMSDFLVEGDVRISKQIKEKYFSSYKGKRLASIIKTNPGWANITYMNDFTRLGSERDYLLGIAFNHIEGNLGYCFELCEMALGRFQGNIFKEIMKLLIEQGDKIKEDISIPVNPLMFNKSLSAILKKFQKLRATNQKFILYGAGTGAEFIMAHMPSFIEYIVDINYEKFQNKFVNKPVLPLEKLKKERKKVLISVFGREGEVTRLLIDKCGLKKNQIISFW